jgi:hypothetical protein
MSSRSSFKSYSESNNIESDIQFFEDSDNDRGFSRKRKGSFFKYQNMVLDDAS